MTNEERVILESAMSKLFKIGKEAMSSLYNEDGELISMDSIIEANVSKQAAHKEEKENQYKRGLKEGSVKFEKAIKQEIDSDLEGVELVAELVSQIQAKASENKLTDQDVEKHPRYIELKTEVEKKVKEAVSEKEADIKRLQVEFEKKETFRTINAKALEMLESLNPVLPEDKAKAESWKKTYLKEFEGFDYQEKDGDYIVLKDGKVYEDSHGNPIKLTDLSKLTADKYFEFNTAEQRKSPANKDSSFLSISIRSREHLNEELRKVGTDTIRRDALLDAAKKSGVLT
jgi:hypothetical protein